jgi:hypothetical protein
MNVAHGLQFIGNDVSVEPCAAAGGARKMKSTAAQRETFDAHGNSSAARKVPE